MEKFYATFMQKQALKDNYVEIIAEISVEDAAAQTPMELARYAMNEHFGRKYAFLYNEDAWRQDNQVEQFGLKKLCTIHAIDRGSHVEFKLL